MNLETEFESQFGEAVGTAVLNDSLNTREVCIGEAAAAGISTLKQQHSDIYFNCMLTKWREQHLASEGAAGDRALLKENMGLINEYGCWCFFEEEFIGGTGPAQDPLDEICRTLSHGYSCIIMDNDEAGTPCTPYDLVYNSAFGSGLAPFGLTMENLNAECDAQNSGGTA